MHTVTGELRDQRTAVHDVRGRSDLRITQCRLAAATGQATYNPEQTEIILLMTTLVNPGCNQQCAELLRSR